MWIFVAHAETRPQAEGVGEHAAKEDIWLTDGGGIEG
jgi:hypothetical protein